MHEQAKHLHDEESIQELDERQQATTTGKLLKLARKERRDKGTKLIKARDLIVLLWIAQQYAVRLDHVQQLLSRMPGRGGKQVSPSGLTFSAVLQVIDRWVTLELVEYRRIYDSEPGWVSVTPSCLKLLHLPFARHTPSKSTLQHLHHINRVRRCLCLRTHSHHHRRVQIGPSLRHLTARWVYDVCCSCSFSQSR